MGSPGHDGRDAALPEDDGLAGLGLVMHLGALIGLGAMIFFAADVLASTAHRPFPAKLSAVAVLGIVRSGAHLAAARAVLYGGVGMSLRRAAGVYAGIAAVHTTVAVAVLEEMVVEPTELVGLAVVLMAWPIALLVVANRPRFARHDRGVPVPDDGGFEGASLLMLVLGLAGALWGAMLLVFVIGELPDNTLASEVGVGFLTIHVALIARGVLHVLAGHAGATGGSPPAITAAASRYHEVGLWSSLCIGGVLFIMLLRSEPRATELYELMFVVYLLLAWPLTLRRFFGVRGLATIAADDDELPQRAPDRGLVSLGWLLLATSVIVLALAIPRALLGTTGSAGMMATLGMFGGGDLAVWFGRSSWWMASIGALQLWAAIELITMSARMRLAATIYGVAGGALTIYVVLPFVRDWKGHVRMFMSSGPSWDVGVIGGAQLAFAIVVPLATLALVNRSRAPHARARFVTTEEPR